MRCPIFLLLCAAARVSAQGGGGPGGGTGGGSGGGGSGGSGPGGGGMMSEAMRAKRHEEQPSGYVRLCSVFSEEGGIPCGNTRTHKQVAAMAATINLLNGGRGFSILGGHSTDPFCTNELGQSCSADTKSDCGGCGGYFKYSYNYTTYPHGEWDRVGKAMSYAIFGSGECDVIVGMAHGCNDTEIVEQALVANATRRIYITGRGPRAVLTQAGEAQPYFFSAHLRSDNYAHTALQRMYLGGARKLAVLYADDVNAFFSGLVAETSRYARDELPALFGVGARGMVALERGFSRQQPAALEAAVDEAVGLTPDVLILVVPGEEWEMALARLEARRQEDHALSFMGVFFQGASWGDPPGRGDCVGTAERCAHVIGATQAAIFYK